MVKLPLAGPWAKNGRRLFYRGQPIRCSYFDKRPSGIHRAVDIEGAVNGEKLVQMIGGRIMRVGYDQKGWGRYVRVDFKVDPKRTSSLLTAHLSKAAVKVGATVGEGYSLGFIGCTGNCSGAHAHIEIWANAGDRHSSGDPFAALHQIYDSQNQVHPILNPYQWPDGSYVIKRGSVGPPVLPVQWALGDSNIDGLWIPDGVFDAGLEVRVKRFQKQHHLKVDGQVGRDSLAALKTVTR